MRWKKARGRITFVVAFVAIVPWQGTIWAAEKGKVERVPVEPNFVEIKKIPQVPATFALGQPEIADVTLAGKTLVITGKKPGTTNVILLDENGDEVFRTTIEVGVGRLVNVRLYDGTIRDRSYLCSSSSCAAAPAATSVPGPEGTATSKIEATQ